MDRTFDFNSNKPALGSAALLFIVGYTLGSGRFEQVSRIGTRLFGTLGLLAYDHFAETFSSIKERLKPTSVTTPSVTPKPMTSSAGESPKVKTARTGT